MNHHIRTATPDDIPAISQIAEDAFHITYADIIPRDQIAYDLARGYSQAALYRQMAKEKHTFLVLEIEAGSHGPEIYGFASLSPHTDYPGQLYLHKLYLDPKSKGQGLGSALMHAAEEQCRTSGFSGLCLTVNRQNSAVRFYQKMGFVIEQELDTAIGGENYMRNDYLMSKDLNPLSASGM